MAAFHADGAKKLISFSPVVSTADEKSDGDYPLQAIMGSLRFHLGSGTRTIASERIRDFELNGEVAICAEDAERLKLKDGDTVRVESRWGTIERKLGCSNRMGPGQVFVPLAVNASDAMNLIDLSDLADPNAGGYLGGPRGVDRLFDRIGRRDKAQHVRFIFGLDDPPPR